MSRMTFSDERIEEVANGAALTGEERQFLVDDTPTFEECTYSRDQLAEMSDADLLKVAYWVWYDYTR